jgi:hypothetical protein
MNSMPVHNLIKTWIDLARDRVEAEQGTVLLTNMSHDEAHEIDVMEESVDTVDGKELEAVDAVVVTEGKRNPDPRRPPTASNPASLEVPSRVLG